MIQTQQNVRVIIRPSIRTDSILQIIFHGLAAVAHATRCCIPKQKNLSPFRHVDGYLAHQNECRK